MVKLCALPCCPRRFSVVLRGAVIDPLQALDGNKQPLTKEDWRIQMRRSIQVLIVGLWVIVGIAVMTSWANAADSRRESATVSFGQWRTDLHPPLEPLDRIVTPLPMGGNNNELIPDVVTIIEGGSVNFIISGLHNTAIYDDKKPEEVNVSSPRPGVGGGIIDDADKRVYRGIDPNLTTTPRDRVEVVHFAEPGVYLVICGVVSHFVNDQMYGYVRVIPARPKK
jgi:hypothetical protein